MFAYEGVFAGWPASWFRLHINYQLDAVTIIYS